MNVKKNKMDAPLGFEPKLTVSKTAILPLDEGAPSFTILII